MKLFFVVYNLAHIDNWVLPLSEYLFDTEIIVFHIATMQGKEFPRNCDKIKSCDVSKMSGKKIMKKLRELNPDICIFLNFRSMFELLMQRICKDLNIHDLYLEHGIFNSNNLAFAGSRKKKEIMETLRRQFAFARKYMDFIACSKHPLREMCVWHGAFLRGHLGVTPYTSYFVYGQRCKDKLSALFDLTDENTTLMGYPLFHFREEEHRAKPVPAEERKGVLYIHQPFIQDQYTSIGYDEERKYLVRMAEALSSRYGDFWVLLHPREDLNAYRKRFEGTGICVIQAPGNYKCFMEKSLCIGHYSTALLFPLYFNVPTYIIDYPCAKIQPLFEEFFPRVHNAEEIGNELKTRQTDKEYLLGKHHSYEYIASLIMELVRK